MFFYIFFFFFQAEDGIRDLIVTGVQTCALPISGLTGASFESGSTRPGARATTRRSEERRVGKSVDLGGRRIIKKKKKRMKEEVGTRSLAPLVCDHEQQQYYDP